MALPQKEDAKKKVKGKRATATLENISSEFSVITSLCFGLAGRMPPRSVSGSKFQACLFASYGGWVLAAVMICAVYCWPVHLVCTTLRPGPQAGTFSNNAEGTKHVRSCPQSEASIYVLLRSNFIFFPAFWEWKGKLQADMCIWTETQEKTKLQGYRWVSSYLSEEMPVQRLLLFIIHRFTHRQKKRHKTTDKILEKQRTNFLWRAATSPSF